MTMSVIEQIEKQASNERAYNIIQDSKGVPIKMWTKGVPVDEKSKDQLLKTAQMM